MERGTMKNEPQTLAPISIIIPSNYEKFKRLWRIFHKISQKHKKTQVFCLGEAILVAGLCEYRLFRYLFLVRIPARLPVLP